jgi:hypothetical protein
MNFIPSEVFSMGIFVNAMVSPFLNWKTTVRSFVCIARQCRVFMNPDWVPIFLGKVNESPSKMCTSFGGSSGTSIFLMTSICWTLDNPGQSNNGLTSSMKVDTMPNDWASWFVQQITHIHVWTLFILNQELDTKNTYSGPKSFNRMTDYSSWSWWTTGSLVIRC